MRLARKPSVEVQREDELEALLVAARAATEFGPDRALDRILDAAIDLVGADEGSIQLLDPSNMTLTVRAARGLSTIAMEHVVPVGTGISGSVVVSGQPLLLASAIDVHRFIGFTPKDRPICGALCVPLRTGAEVIGVLSVNMMRPGRPFTERDLRLVSLFAENAAIALANGRLLNEAQRHARELEVLRGSMVRLSTTLDLPTVTEAILREGLSIAGSDTGFVFVATDPSRPLELARFSGIAKDRLRSLLSGAAIRAMAAGTDLRVVTDLASEPSLSTIAPDLNGRALAMMPLRTAEGTASGLLGIAIPHDAAAETKRLMSTYAVQAGLALSNAMMYETATSRERELDTIVSTLDLPIILIDENGRYRSINPAAATVFGLIPDFELGRPVRGTLGYELEELALDTTDDVSMEAAVRVGNEERTYRVIAASASRDRGGRILVLVDLSNLHDLERRKADFLAVIGHELRTPLTSIKGYAHTLDARRRTLPPEVQDRCVQSILTQSHRLERLIEDLLYVSRVENHRPPVHLAWDDVVDIATSVLREAAEGAPERIIKVDAPPDLPILTDRVKVEQALAHVIDNALKYSEEDPIEIVIASDERTVSIAVRDHGPGLYSGDVERIFDPFTQVDSSSTRRHGGTGLGLYVAKTLIETLGGRIEVDSAPGHGATFTLLLPLRAVDI
jgi:signal transduction histidine kinase